MSPRPSIADVRLVALDLDGTLLRSDLTVSARTKAAIAALRTSGVEVVLATARSPRSVRGIAQTAGVGGVAVCANGAITYDLDRAEILLHTPLEPPVAHRLVRGLRERVEGVAFGWELELRFGSEPGYEALRDPLWPRPRGSYPPCDPLTWTRPMTKLLARAPGTDLERVLEIAREVAGAKASVTLAGNAFVELAAAGVGKEQALAALAAAAGIAASQVVAVGDHLTDLGMLDWAGTGVAMANAHPKVVAAADEVTGTNDEDGVASVLERLLADVDRRQPSSSESVGA
jgi:hydroxymethylpyrimidine pyrophosphatase-like HAD family hydrolase